MLATVTSADPWLCTADQSMGFAFRNGSWVPATFAVEDGQFILRKLTKDEFYYRSNNQYRLFQPGIEMLGMPCGGDSIAENYFCGDVNRQVKFSTQSGRFPITFMNGYWGNVTAETPENPQITIGRCSKI